MIANLICRFWGCDVHEIHLFQAEKTAPTVTIWQCRRCKEVTGGTAR